MPNQRKTYRVVAGTSVRASADPTSTDFERWVDFHAGQRVSSWPDHAPIDEWLATGHWIDPDAPKDEKESD